MARFLHFIHSSTKRKHPYQFLAYSWLLGLGAGGAAFRYAGNFLVPLMPLAAIGQPSIVSLFLRTSFPFLICACLVYLDKPKLLPALCLCRAFLYSYVLCAVFTAFEGCGWLIRWFLLFTPTFSCCMLYGLAQRYLSGLRKLSLIALGFWVLAIAILVCVDYFYVSPFLRQLLS